MRYTDKAGVLVEAVQLTPATRDQVIEQLEDWGLRPTTVPSGQLAICGAYDGQLMPVQFSDYVVRAYQGARRVMMAAAFAEQFTPLEGDGNG